MFEGDNYFGAPEAHSAPKSNDWLQLVQISKNDLSTHGNDNSPVPPGLLPLVELIHSGAQPSSPDNSELPLCPGSLLPNVINRDKSRNDDNVDSTPRSPEHERPISVKEIAESIVKNNGFGPKGSDARAKIENALSAALEKNHDGSVAAQLVKQLNAELVLAGSPLRVEEQIGAGGGGGGRGNQREEHSEATGRFTIKEDGEAKDSIEVRVSKSTVISDEEANGCAESDGTACGGDNPGPIRGEGAGAEAGDKQLKAYAKAISDGEVSEELAKAFVDTIRKNGIKGIREFQDQLNKELEKQGSESRVTIDNVTDIDAKTVETYIGIGKPGKPPVAGMFIVSRIK